MVIPLKDPKQRDIVVGVVSVLRGHDGGPVERFGEAELAEAPVNIGLLVQLITWASTATRHKRSHEQRTRLMDVIMLIADTQEVSKARRASGIYSMPSQGSVDTASEGKGKGMRLDELLELARVSLAAQVAVLHTMDTMDTRFLKMHTVKRGGLQHSDELLSEILDDTDEEGEGMDASGKGDMSTRQETAIKGKKRYIRRQRSSTEMALTDEGEKELARAKADAAAKEAEWNMQQRRRRCAMGQGIIGFCALTGETVNTELSREVYELDGIQTSGRLRDPEDQLDIGVDIPPGLEPNDMALCCVPIVDLHGSCVGVLEVLNKESSYKGSVMQFSESDITIMRILSTAFAMALENAK